MFNISINLLTIRVWLCDLPCLQSFKPFDCGVKFLYFTISLDESINNVFAFTTLSLLVNVNNDCGRSRLSQ